MKLKVIAHPTVEGLELAVNRFIERKELFSISFSKDNSWFYAYIVYKEC